MTIAIVTSIILTVLLIVDIVLTIKKLIGMARLLELIEHGEVSYINAVKSIVDMYGLDKQVYGLDEQKKPLRRGKAVPWSERNRESQSR